MTDDEDLIRALNARGFVTLFIDGFMRVVDLKDDAPVSDTLPPMDATGGFRIGRTRMMGHREPLKSGDEYDAFTRWRRVLHWRPGERTSIKQHFWKRQRRIRIESE